MPSKRKKRRSKRKKKKDNVAGNEPASDNIDEASPAVVEALTEVMKTTITIDDIDKLIKDKGITSMKDFKETKLYKDNDWSSDSMANLLAMVEGKFVKEDNPLIESTDNNSPSDEKDKKDSDVETDSDESSSEQETNEVQEIGKEVKQNTKVIVVPDENVHIRTDPPKVPKEYNNVPELHQKDEKFNGISLEMVADSVHKDEISLRSVSIDSVIQNDENPRASRSIFELLGLASVVHEKMARLPHSQRASFMEVLRSIIIPILSVTGTDDTGLDSLVVGNIKQPIRRRHETPLGKLARNRMDQEDAPYRATHLLNPEFQIDQHKTRMLQHFKTMKKYTQKGNMTFTPREMFMFTSAETRTVNPVILNPQTSSSAKYFQHNTIEIDGMRLPAHLLRGRVKLTERGSVTELQRSESTHPEVEKFIRKVKIGDTICTEREDASRNMMLMHGVALNNLLEQCLMGLPEYMTTKGSDLKKVQVTFDNLSVNARDFVYSTGCLPLCYCVLSELAGVYTQVKLDQGTREASILKLETPPCRNSYEDYLLQSRTVSGASRPVTDSLMEGVVAEASRPITDLLNVLSPAMKDGKQQLEYNGRIPPPSDIESILGLQDGCKFLNGAARVLLTGAYRRVRISDTFDIHAHPTFGSGPSPRIVAFGSVFMLLTIPWEYFDSKGRWQLLTSILSVFSRNPDRLAPSFLSTTDLQNLKITTASDHDKGYYERVFLNTHTSTTYVGAQVGRDENLQRINKFWARLSMYIKELISGEHYIGRQKLSVFGTINVGGMRRDATGALSNDSVLGMLQSEEGAALTGMHGFPTTAQNVDGSITEIMRLNFTFPLCSDDIGVGQQRLDAKFRRTDRGLNPDAMKERLRSDRSGLDEIREKAQNSTMRKSLRKRWFDLIFNTEELYANILPNVRHGIIRNVKTMLQNTTPCEEFFILFAKLVQTAGPSVGPLCMSKDRVPPILTTTGALSETVDVYGVVYLSPIDAAAAFFHGVELQGTREFVTTLSTFSPRLSAMRMTNTMQLSIAEMCFSQSLQLFLELGWYGRDFSKYPSNRLELRKVYGTFIFGTMKFKKFHVRRVETNIDQRYEAFFRVNTYFLSHHRDLMLEFALMLFRSFSTEPSPYYESFITDLIKNKLDAILYAKRSAITYDGSNGPVIVSEIEKYRVYRVCDEPMFRQIPPFFIDNVGGMGERVIKPVYNFYSYPYSENMRRGNQIMQQYHITPFSTITSHFIRLRDGSYGYPKELKKSQYPLIGYSSLVGHGHDELRTLMYEHLDILQKRPVINPFVIERTLGLTSFGSVQSVNEHHPIDTNGYVPYRPFNRVHTTIFPKRMIVENHGISSKANDYDTYRAEDHVKRAEVFSIGDVRNYAKKDIRLFCRVSESHAQARVYLHEFTKMVGVVERGHRPHTFHQSFSYIGRTRLWNDANNIVPMGDFVTSLAFMDSHSGLFNYYKGAFRKLVTKVIASPQPMVSGPQGIIGMKQDTHVRLIRDDLGSRHSMTIKVDSNLVEGRIQVSDERTSEKVSIMSSCNSLLKGKVLDVNDLVKFFTAINKDIGGDAMGGDVFRTYMNLREILAIPDSELRRRGLCEQAIKDYKQLVLHELSKRTFIPQMGPRFSRGSVHYGWTRLYQDNLTDKTTGIMRERIINGPQFGPPIPGYMGDIDVFNVTRISRTEVGQVTGSYTTPTVLSPLESHQQKIFMQLLESLTASKDLTTLRIVDAKVWCECVFEDEHKGPEKLITLKNKVVTAKELAAITPVERYNSNGQPMNPDWVQEEIGKDGRRTMNERSIMRKLTNRGIEMTTYYPMESMHFQAPTQMTHSNRLSYAEPTDHIVLMKSSNVDPNRYGASLITEDRVLYLNDVNGLTMVSADGRTYKREVGNPYKKFPNPISLITPVKFPKWVEEESTMMNVAGGRILMNGQTYDSDLMHEMTHTRVNGPGFGVSNMSTKAFSLRDDAKISVERYPPLMGNTLTTKISDVLLNEPNPDILRLPKVGSNSLPYTKGNLLTPQNGVGMNYTHTDLDTQVVVLASENWNRVHLLDASQRGYCFAMKPSGPQSITVTRLLTLDGAVD